MKAILLGTAILIAAAGLAVPAQAQMGGMGMGGNPRGWRYRHARCQASTAAPRTNINPEGEAEDLRLAGKCDQAVPILRRLVNSAQSYPISKYNLGLCLLDLAAAEHDAAKAADLRQKGAVWIVRAADAGFGQAEVKAVLLYLDGVGVAADPVEAEKWALIYHSNGMRFALGLPDVAPEVRDRLDAALTDAQRDAAQARADDWTAKLPRLDR